MFNPASVSIDSEALAEQLFMKNIQKQDEEFAQLQLEDYTEIAMDTSETEGEFREAFYENAQEDFMQAPVSESHLNPEYLLNLANSKTEKLCSMRKECPMRVELQLKTFIMSLKIRIREDDEFLLPLADDVVTTQEEMNCEMMEWESRDDADLLKKVH